MGIGLDLENTVIVAPVFHIQDYITDMPYSPVDSSDFVFGQTIKIGPSLH